VRNEDEDEVRQIPTKRTQTPLTRYVLVSDGGNKNPFTVQEIPNQDGNDVNTPDSTDGVGKGDRLFDYYSDRLSSGPYVTDSEGNNNPVLNSFVQYAVPPPPPPHLAGQQPIMANVYWRKIIYPVSMMPMEQNAALGSSAAASSLDQSSEKSISSTGKPTSHKYIVYYVKKNNNTSDQGMRLSSSNGEQQQQLAQSIIRQIEMLEDEKVNGPTLTVSKSPTELDDQDISNSQVKLKVVKKKKPQVVTQLIEVSPTAKRRPSKGSRLPITIRHQNVFSHPFYEQDFTRKRTSTRRTRTSNRARTFQKRLKATNPYTDRIVLADRHNHRVKHKRPVIRVMKI